MEDDDDDLEPLVDDNLFNAINDALSSNESPMEANRTLEGKYNAVYAKTSSVTGQCQAKLVCDW